MQEKLVNYIMLTFLLILGILYFISANTLEGSGVTSGKIGPGYFPRVICIIFILLCLISFVQTIFRKNEDGNKFTVPNFRLIVITIFITLLFVLSWYYIGYFYINLALYLFILFVVFQKYTKNINKKKIFMNIMISVLFSIAVYYIFGGLFNIQF